MEEFVKGDVVVLPFPFSNLSTSKKRPALIVGNPEGNDVILAQITTTSKIDDYSIQISNSDFGEGSLNLSSIIKPQRLFTADKSILLYKAGTLNKSKIKEVEKEIIKIITE